MKKKTILSGILALVMACSAGVPFVSVSAAAAENASATSTAQNYADEVAALINQERAAQGLNTLKVVPALNQAAKIRSQELVTSFSHTRPDGRSCSTVLNDNQIAWRTTGENIAYGYSTPEAVMDGWMHSDGHRANILNASFDAVGVGVISHNGVLYWTQIFTGGGKNTDAYQPVKDDSKPEFTYTVPESKTADSVCQPCNTCIGDTCFDCTGMNCTSQKDIFSCLNGSCNTQDILSALNQNCTNGNCNIFSFCK